MRVVLLRDRRLEGRQAEPLLVMEVHSRAMEVIRQRGWLCLRVMPPPEFEPVAPWSVLPANAKTVTAEDVRVVAFGVEPALLIECSNKVAEILSDPAIGDEDVGHLPRSRLRERQLFISSLRSRIERC